jgi:branched-chain amino acid aminotransferase
VFRLREHFERMRGNCRLLRIELPGDSAALAEVTLDLLRRNEFRTDVYVRPLAYKAARSIKVALQDLRDGFGMFAFPIGSYLPTSGLAARTSTWRRTADDSIPARGKLTGAYINTALAVDEAHDANADESIFLTRDGHVSEGGSANLFMVRDGELITPAVTDDILEGITRDVIMTVAREEFGLTVTERAIDRTELFIADEVFFCGTGAQVAPCVKVDGRVVGDGNIGPIARRIGDLYYAIARGDDKRHADWRTAVYR